MPPRLAQIPDISEDFNRYAELNPAFSAESSDPHAPAALAEMNAVFFKDPKKLSKPREHNDICRQIRLFQIAIQIKIEQLLSNPVWTEKQGSTEAEFEASPRTFLKTVQEVLCEPSERMVFERSDELIDPENAKNGLASLVIDPRRITNTLLKNLGLEEYLPPKGITQEEQLQHRAKAIPAIREMLAALEPVKLPGRKPQDDNYFRLMRMTGGPSRGQVIGTQNIAGEKILFKSDLHGARRRLLHIEAGYHEEMRTLKWIEHSIREVDHKPDIWQDPANGAEAKALKDGLLSSVKLLKHVQNESKQSLAEEIKNILKATDATHPANPAETRSHTVKALELLGDRYGEIEGIWKHVGWDKAKLEQVISEQEIPMQLFSEKVETLHEKFRILRPERALTDNERSKITGNLMELRVDAGNMKFEPHLTFGTKFIAQIDTVLALLAAKDDQPAAKEFVKTYLITKIARTYADLQLKYEDLSLQGRILNPNDLLAELTRIEEELKTHLVAPQILTTEYNAGFHQVYGLLETLKMKLTDLTSSKPATTDPSRAPAPAPAFAPAPDSTTRTTPPSSGPTPKSPSTLDDIIEKLKTRAPKLTGFLGRITDKITKIVKSTFVGKILKSWTDTSARATTPARSPATPPPTAPSHSSASTPASPAFTADQKQKTYSEMKELIGAFDFANLVKALS